MNIEKIINDQVKEMVDGKSIESLIAESVKSSIENVVKDKFTGYSFRQIIENKLKEQIDPILKEIDFTAYGAEVVNRVLAVMKSVSSKEVGDQVEKLYKDLFDIDRKELLISEVFELYRESLLDEEDYDRGDANFNVSYEEKVEGAFTSLTIKFDNGETGYSKEENELYFSYYKEVKSTNISRLKTNNFTLWSSESDKSPLVKASYISKWEKLLLNAFLKETPVVIDIEEDEIETYIGNNEY